MLATETASNRLSNTLTALSQKQATGKLLLENEEQQWQIYLFKGHLVYATGGWHQTRRWYRAVKQNCQNLRVNASLVSGKELWEYQMLQQAIADAQITIEQAKGIVTSSAYEVFFSLLSQPTLKREWSPQKQQTREIISDLLLSAVEMQKVLSSARTLWEEWNAMGLGSVFPEQAPILKPSKNLQKRVSDRSLLVLNKKFNGQNTLWDLVLKKQDAWTALPQVLSRFLKQGWIEMKGVPDLPSPFEQLRLVYSAMNRPQRIIACIDSSQVGVSYLEKILAPAGYGVVKILDPFEGISILAKSKPDLIFLDLAIPDVNGFSLCRFLRETPRFKAVPIAILSKQDDWITRVRAKFAGASDFARKPASSKQILALVDKYLKGSQNSN
jgi:chemotaxis family two-component system response regulator PixG